MQPYNYATSVHIRRTSCERGMGLDTLCPNPQRHGHTSPTNELGQLDDERKQSGKPAADEPVHSQPAERGGRSPCCSVGS